MADRNSGRAWTAYEDKLLRAAYDVYQEDWPKVATMVPGRTNKACRKRWLHSLSPRVKKTPWTPEEDRLLLDLYNQHPQKWSVICRSIEGRTDDACSKRYSEALDPRLKQGDWTPEEDAQLLDAVPRHQQRWKDIGLELSRSSLSCRNRWRLLLRKNQKEKDKRPSGDTATVATQRAGPSTDSPPSSLPVSPDLHSSQSLESTPGCSQTQLDPSIHDTSSFPSLFGLEQNYWDNSLSESSPYSAHTPLLLSDPPPQADPRPGEVIDLSQHVDVPLRVRTPPPFCYTSSSLSAALSEVRIPPKPLPSVHVPPIPPPPSDHAIGVPQEPPAPSHPTPSSSNPSPLGLEPPPQPYAGRLNPSPLGLSPPTCASLPDADVYMSPSTSQEPFDAWAASTPVDLGSSSSYPEWNIFSPPAHYASASYDGSIPPLPHDAYAHNYEYAPGADAGSSQSTPALSVGYTNYLSSAASTPASIPTPLSASPTIYSDAALSAATSPTTFGTPALSPPGDASPHKGAMDLAGAEPAPSALFSSPHYRIATEPPAKRTPGSEPLRLSADRPAAQDESIRPYACGNDACWPEGARGADAYVAFTTAKGLLEHVRVRHRGCIEGERPFRCALPGCGKAWKSINGLQYHLQVSRTHFSKAMQTLSPALSPTDAAPEDDAPRRGARVYRCECGKEYRQSSGLRYHQRRGHHHASSQLDQVPHALLAKAKTKSRTRLQQAHGQ